MQRVVGYRLFPEDEEDETVGGAQAAWSSAAALGDDVLKYWAPVLALVLSGPCLVVDMRPPGPRAISATSISKGNNLDVNVLRW